jgi:hypothetical protein
LLDLQKTFKKHLSKNALCKFKNTKREAIKKGGKAAWIRCLRSFPWWNKAWKKRAADEIFFAKYLGGDML